MFHTPQCFDDRILVHRFEYYDKEHKTSLGGRSSIITVEFAKLRDAAEKPVGRMTAEEHWAMFFRYLADASKRDTINKILDKEEGIAMASEVLMTISKDERERAYQLSRYKFETDWQSKMVDAKRAGRAEGRVEGRAEGILEGKRETARKMKQHGDAIPHIAAITGLNAEEIEKL